MVTYSFTLAGIEHFLLVLARIASFMFVAPFFSQQGFPSLTKVGLASVISLLVVQSMELTEAVYYSAIGYGILVFKEVITGLMLGYVVNACQYVITYAGNLIDMDIGLSMASQFDPALNTNVTITGNIYYYFMLMLFLISDVHTYFLKAFIDTFELMPLGGQTFRWDFLLSGMISFMTNFFILGFRIFLPIFATMLVVNIVLGVMAKVAPQMNMFSVGMQIKVITGIIVLFFMVFLFPGVVELLFNQMIINFTNFKTGIS